MTALAIRLAGLRAALLGLRPGGAMLFHGGGRAVRATDSPNTGRPRYSLYAGGRYLRTYSTPTGAARAIAAFEDEAR